jgi:hypothetical protein
MTPEERAAEWTAAETDAEHLAIIIREAEARGRLAGLEEAAKECDQEIATQAMCLQESASRSAGACARRIRAMMHEAGRGREGR